MADAVDVAGLPCHVYGDGMSVRIDAATVYEPDALVRCGAELPGDAPAVADPLIVVEVLSPSTSSVDTGIKLTDYFGIPSLRHYLLVRAERRTVVLHSRTETGEILTRIVSGGPIALDPPGIVLDGIFPPEGGR